MSYIFLVGKDSSGEAVEGASVFVFTTLKDADHIGKNESTKLRNFFGAFPASSATKACHIVHSLISLLSEDCLAIINKRSEEKHNEPLKEFGSDIKFTPVKKKDPSLDEALLSDSEDERVDVKISFSSIKEEPAALRDKPPSDATNGPDDITGSWLRDQCELYFAESSSGVSFLDLCSALFDILTSDRDNAAIQNDLFELLGFDRFEFIQTLLANRHRIVIATSESASDLNESNIGKVSESIIIKLLCLNFKMIPPLLHCAPSLFIYIISLMIILCSYIVHHHCSFYTITVHVLYTIIVLPRTVHKISVIIPVHCAPSLLNASSIFIHCAPSLFIYIINVHVCTIVAH